MRILGRSLSPWTLLLLAALLSVAAVGALGGGGPHRLLAALAATALLGISLGWHRSLDACRQPESEPKLRVLGLAILVLLLTFLYGLVMAALPLPGLLQRLAPALLLAVAAASVVVIMSAFVDVSMPVRHRWPRIAAWMLGAGYATTLLSALLRDPSRPASLVDPVTTPYPLAILAVLLAAAAPLDWVLDLDRRQRLLVLGLATLSILPLAAGVSVARLFDVPGLGPLAEAVRVGSLVALVFLLVIGGRAALALPGAGAYERKVRELDAVYDFGLTAGSAFDPRQLREAVLHSMLKVAEPDVALVVEPQPEGDGCRCVLLRHDAAGQHLYRFATRAGWMAIADRFADRRPLLVVDHAKAPAGVLARIWEPSSGSSVIVPVLPRSGQPRALLIAGRFQQYAFTRSEVRSLVGFATQVALAFDHARLLRETVEAERRKRELEIARELQLNLLPKQPPELVGFDIADRSEPATEVGGDYFDYLRLDADRFGLVLGDVAGHGMPAGLLMAMAKSAIHTQVQSGEALPALLERLSNTLLQMSADNQFMTMVLVELDLATGAYRYANAGHHYPFHYRASTGEVVDLRSTGLPLGMLPRPPGPFRSGRLDPGDVLLLYSDGIVEAFRSTDEEMFGLPRLREVLVANHDQPAKTIVEAVFHAVREFCSGAPLHDDATMVVLRASEAPANPGGDNA